MNKTYYYARVSTNEQNLDRQVEAFKALGADERDIITDKASGKDTERENYQIMKRNFLRDGDTLVVKSLDRLSRCKSDTARELQYYREHNIRVKVLDIPTTMIDYPDGQEWVLNMVNNILIEVLSTIAEQERKTIRARQAEGIAVMKRNKNGKRVSAKTGREMGRPALEAPANWDEVYTSWKDKKITAVKAIELLQISKTSFYKLVKAVETN